MPDETNDQLPNETPPTLDEGARNSPDNTMTFHITGEEVLRLDGNGMTYKGQRIEDAGEAHRAWMLVMAQMSAAAEAAAAPVMINEDRPRLQACQSFIRDLRLNRLLNPQQEEQADKLLKG